MAFRQFTLLGLRTTLFAASGRAGVELSLPLGARRRSGAPPAPAADIADAGVARTDPQRAALAKRVGELTWYHTLDLPYGVVTPGFMDHRSILDRYMLPQRLAGLRVLDVASFDGFWSFEFERRGAAEVVALDIATARELDLPFVAGERMSESELGRPFGAGFALAHETLQSKVRKVHCSVYDLTPEKLGQFDLVHCGDVLLHLRDPARALRNIRRVTRGYALLSDCIYPDLDRQDLPLMQYEGASSENIWWRFGSIALQRMIADAGFADVTELTRFRYGPRGMPQSMWHSVIRATP